MGAGDLSLAACLPSETLGVGADAAVSYGPPTPMLLLCLVSGCRPPPPMWLVWWAPTPFPGHPLRGGFKQVIPVLKLLQATEDTWRTPMLPWSPGWPGAVGASLFVSLGFPLIEMEGVQRQLSSAPPPLTMHTAGVNECLRSKYRVGAKPELAQVLPTRRKRSLIFAVDWLSVCQRIGGRGTALIFFPSVSDLAVPSSPSPEGMTCQSLSVQSGQSGLSRSLGGLLGHP